MNSSSTCGISQTEGPLINTLPWFCFSQRHNVYARCREAVRAARVTDIDSSHMFESRQAEYDAVLGLVLITSTLRNTFHAFRAARRRGGTTNIPQTNVLEQP